jgi:hypothetical protein
LGGLGAERCFGFSDGGELGFPSLFEAAGDEASTA